MEHDLAELLGNVQSANVIRDGDTLVLRVANTSISRQQFDELVEAVSVPFKDRLPNVELVFIAGIDEMLIYRPGEANQT